MTVRALTVDDLEWAVETLGRRRANLVPFAPVLWRPATSASQVHLAFLRSLITSGGALGFRTDHALLIAAPGRPSWNVDDAFVPPGQWGTDGQQLWDALAARIGGERVRFVCPVFEVERAHFASSAGLTVADSWWHIDVPHQDQGAKGCDHQVTGAAAVLVLAPPIYDPGGPVLFLSEVANPSTALPAAWKSAAAQQCPLVIVNQPADNIELGDALTSAHYKHHCDFLDGII